jgi:hypothetical protein
MIAVESAAEYGAVSWKLLKMNYRKVSIGVPYALLDWPGWLT